MHHNQCSQLKYSVKFKVISWKAKMAISRTFLNYISMKCLELETLISKQKNKGRYYFSLLLLLVMVVGVIIFKTSLVFVAIMTLRLMMFALG